MFLLKAVRKMRRGAIGSLGSPRPRLRQSHGTRRPVLEELEPRTLLSTLMVLNNHDSGTGSLRAVLAAAGSHVLPHGYMRAAVPRAAASHWSSVGKPPP